ncbi:MAG: hypothetical protein GTO18_22185 [Anaerolineales bacterium]|nr:hypothetical protein [Anaerolineales bacterium]
MRGRRILLVIVVISMAMITCSPFGGGERPTSTTPIETTETGETPAVVPTSPSNPLHVQISLEEANATEEAIPIDGGTIETTAADGTHYTLTLPHNALLSEEIVTITPVEEVDGLPLSGGLVASLHIQPEGLRLFEPATLTVEPAHMERSNQFQLIGFAYHGEGQEFHLYPIEVEEDAFTIRLMHFSGYGAGLGTPIDVEAQRSEHPPSSPEDQAYQDVDPGAGEEALYQQWLARWRSIFGLLVSAQSDENMVDIALFEFTTWRDIVRGFGLEPRFMGEIQQGWEALVSAVTFAAHSAYASCVTKHDPTQIARILRWITWAQRNPEVLARLDINQIQEFARKCAQFELDFDSVIDYKDPDGASAYSHVRATHILIELSQETIHTDSRYLHLHGDGPLEYLEHSSFIPQDSDGCVEVLDHTEDGWLHIEDLKLDINLNFFPGSTIYIFPSPEPRITMRFDYDPFPEEIYNTICEDSQVSMEAGFWWGSFDFLHMDELTDYEGFVFEDWTHVGSYETFASKSYDQTLEGILHEKTNLELRHTPE